MKRTERTVRLLPPPLKAAAKSVRNALDPAYVRAYRGRTGYAGKIPPGHLRARSGNPGVESFVEGGRRNAQELEGGLAAVGRSLSGVGSVLDFGCGCGRVLPHLMERVGPHASFTGSDVDREAISWAAAHYPRASWTVNCARPPLSAGDDAFDLVYSISIFTHLDERLQRDWLRELGRVLAPGGLALLTVHGRSAFDQFKSGDVISNTRSCSRRVAVHGSLDDEGFIHEPYSRSRWSERDYPGADPAFGLAFHSEAYLRTAWRELFEVLELLPQAISGWQDLVVVRNPESRSA